MFNRRQYELIRNLCLAGLHSPDTGFALARELIEIGEAADAEIGTIIALKNDTVTLAAADRIKAAQSAAPRAV